MDFISCFAINAYAIGINREYLWSVLNIANIFGHWPFGAVDLHWLSVAQEVIGRTRRAAGFFGEKGNNVKYYILSVYLLIYNIH